MPYNHIWPPTELIVQGTIATLPILTPTSDVVFVHPDGELDFVVTEVNGSGAADLIMVAQT